MQSSQHSLQEPNAKSTRQGRCDNLTTPERVQDIVKNNDGAIRNVQITQSYHEFTLAFDAFVAHRDGPWCMFATWVSKQVGFFIRNEEIPEPLRHFLGLDGRRRWWAYLTPRAWFLSKPFLTYIRGTVEDVSRHLADGNRLVYANLGAVFADFLLLLRRSGRSPDPEQLKEFLRKLEQDPINGEEIGRGFAHFYHAVFEPTPKIRAERIFMTNLLIGFHEQVRLQEALDGAFKSPIHRALEDPNRLFTQFPLPRWMRKWGAALFKSVMAPAIRSFEEEWQEVITKCLLIVTLPHDVLDTDKDVPPLPNGDMYPAALTLLTLPEAKELVAELDYTPDTTQGSGARNWVRLGDRMNYVVDFFRSRQQDRDLLLSPFTPEQVKAIYAGRLPEGPL